MANAQMRCCVLLATGTDALPGLFRGTAEVGRFSRVLPGFAPVLLKQECPQLGQGTAW